MILKANHLYRVDIPTSMFLKKYCLIAPRETIDTDDPNNSYGVNLECVVCISVTDEFYIGGSLWFTFNGRKSEFKKPSVKDVMEMVHRMKAEGDNFRYDLKTREIRSKYDIKSETHI